MSSDAIRSLSLFVVFFPAAYAATLPVTVDKSPVIAQSGSTVLLGCHFTISSGPVDLSKLAITWRFRGKELAKYDEDAEEELTYSQRAKLFPDEFKNGDASLSLTNVIPADAGAYTCSIVYNLAVGSKKITLEVVAAPTPADTKEKGETTAAPTPADTKEKGETTVAPTPADTKEKGETTAAPTPADTEEKGETTAAPTPADAKEKGETTAAPTPADTEEKGETTASPTPADTKEKGEITAAPTPADTKEKGETTAVIQKIGGTEAGQRNSGLSTAAGTLVLPIVMMVMCLIHEKIFCGYT